MQHVGQMASDQVPADRFPGEQGVDVLIRILGRGRVETFQLRSRWTTFEAWISGVAGLQVGGPGGLKSKSVSFKVNFICTTILARPHAP